MFDIGELPEGINSRQQPEGAICVLRTLRSWLGQCTYISQNQIFCDVNENSKMAHTLRNASRFPFLALFCAQQFPSPAALTYEETENMTSVYARFRGDPFEIVCYGSSAHIFATRPYLLKNKVSKSIFSLNKSCSQNLCKIFLYLAVFVIIVHNPFSDFCVILKIRQ